MLYALTWRRWTMPLLLSPIAASGALLFGGDGDKGWSWEGFPAGALRWAYGFPFGVLIYRLHAAGWRAPSLPGIVCLAAFSALLLAPPRFVVPVAVLAGAPCVVAFAASAKSGRATAPLFSALGLASYALYAVHVPLLNATRAALFALHVSPNPYVAGFAFLAAIVPACILLDWIYDDPVGRRLTQALLDDARPPVRTLGGPAVSRASP